MLPVWNCESFVREAISSILRQTLLDLEVIVVDDGSDDGSLKIVRELAAADPRLVVIATGHEGLGHALNAAIEVARGQYIARMDADDIAEPTRLEKQVAYLDAHHDCVAVGSDIVIVDEIGDELCSVEYPHAHAEIVQALVSLRAALSHPTMVMRRDGLLAAGGYRQDRFPAEDLDLWLRLSERGRLANIPSTLR